MMIPSRALTRSSLSPATLLALLFCFSVIAAPAFAQPSTEQRLQTLEQKFKLLEARMAELQAELKRTQAAAKSAKTTASPSDVDQEAALALLRGARGDVSAGRIEEAKKKLAEIDSNYANTKSARHARQFGKEVALLGTDAGTLEIERWYGDGEAGIDDGELTVLVFWEVWCPHCKREVPKLQALYEKYRDQGLNLIGLTKVTKSATDEKVEAFIVDHGLTYPTAKEKDGAMSKRFAVSGVPAAAAVRDGKVVWRGHPSRLSDSHVEKLLAGSEG